MGFCTNTMKIILHVINLLILISGIICIVVGGNTMIKNENFEGIVYNGIDYSRGAEGVLIGAGVLLIIYSFFGFIGVWKESKWMLIIYVIFLTLFFAILLVAGIIGFLIKALDSEVMEEMEKSLKRAGHPDEYTTKNRWDSLQLTFKCCGVVNYNDWRTIAGIEFPTSCCDDDVVTVNPRCEPYIDGCYDKFMNAAELLGGIGTGISLIMFFGMLFTCGVICRNRSIHYKA